MVQESSHMLALSFLYHNYLWQKLITMKWFRVVWLCPSFCFRNHTIWRMSRVWHQPSQVGKAYYWFQCWNCLGSSELRLITLVLLWQHFVEGSGLIKAWFSVAWLPFCHNYGDSPLFWMREDFCILPHFRLFSSSVGILLLQDYCFGKQWTKIVELLKFNFIFCFG
jgi:hypothetical protein